MAEPSTSDNLLLRECFQGDNYSFRNAQVGPFQALAGEVEGGGGAGFVFELVEAVAGQVRRAARDKPLPYPEQTADPSADLPQAGSG